MTFNSKKWAVAALVLVMAASLAFYALLDSPSAPVSTGQAFSTDNALALDLASPDALIRSSALSRLPVDLLRVPLARDVLTEDFVDYYEHNESREALLGTLKRIAYEHRLDISDRIVRAVFDEPAEIALWRDKGGRLNHFALVMTRNALARIIGLLLPLSDAQMTSAGTLNGTNTPILILEYGLRRRLVLLTQGDRIVVLSDPGMLLMSREPGAGQSDSAARLIAELLKSEAKISPFTRHFSLDALEELPEKTHEITLGTSVFLFGYAYFTPGLRALNLRFDATGQWQSAANLEPGATGALWTALPRGAGLCAALPLALPRAASLAEEYLAFESTGVLQSLGSAAAACLYGNSRLYAPLFAVRLTAVPDEARARVLLGMGESITAMAGTERFDPKTGTGLWRASNSIYELRPAWGLAGDALFFSPDASLVERALDVAAKRYPAVADDFASETSADTLAVIDPKPLATLLRREMFAALPRAEEPDFRNAAEAWLAPRLDALARYPAQRVRLGTSHGEWRTLVWESLKK